MKKISISLLTSAKYGNTRLKRKNSVPLTHNTATVTQCLESVTHYFAPLHPTSYVCINKIATDMIQKRIHHNSPIGEAGKGGRS